eukprot:4385217-Lingulodinium_polyedra.AAC.1
MGRLATETATSALPRAAEERPATEPATSSPCSSSSSITTSPPSRDDRACQTIALVAARTSRL